MKKVTDFEIMQAIADEATSDGIAMFPDMVSVNRAKRGCHITIGAPAVVMQWAFAESHYIMCYAIKKEDYWRIRKQLESKLKPQK